MIKKPLVLALGRGFSTGEGLDLYNHLKHLVDFHWFETPLDDDTRSKFLKSHGQPLILLLYGASIAHVSDDFLAPYLPGLRLLCSSGAGFDNIDIAYCTKNRIWVSNTPNSVTDSTANCAVWLILTGLRKFNRAMESATSGSWREAMSGPFLDPVDLTIGIVGLGRIGSSVARKMAVFGMRIVYTSRHRVSEEIERESGNARYISDLGDLVSQCDVVSVHVPLNASTTHLFNAKIFKKFKRSGMFVNTARGRIHDEHALIEALNQKMVGFAALDVFEGEPTISPEFLRGGSLADRVVVTPHIGALSEQAKKKMEIELLENIKGLIEDDQPKYPVNEPVK